MLREISEPHPYKGAKHCRECWNNYHRLYRRRKREGKAEVPSTPQQIQPAEDIAQTLP